MENKEQLVNEIFNKMRELENNISEKDWFSFLVDLSDEFNFDFTLCG